jgi:hypothetical protein
LRNVKSLALSIRIYGHMTADSAIGHNLERIVNAKPTS